MRISELIAMLEMEKSRVGDVEVTMQATMLSDGFSASGSASMPDVFESTVETAICKQDGKLGKRLRLYWQK